MTDLTDFQRRVHLPAMEKADQVIERLEAERDQALATIEAVRAWAEGVQGRRWDRDPVYGDRDSYNGGLTSAAQHVLSLLPEESE